LKYVESLDRWVRRPFDFVSFGRTLKCFGAAVFGLSIMINAHADSTPSTERPSQQAPGLPTGISRFMFSGWEGPELRVWTYVPSSLDADAPILFVMHGVERDAKRYLEDWARTAERHGVILVAPEFDERRFPGSESYNQGGIVDPGSGKKLPREVWTFSVIEPLFEEVRRRSGSNSITYSIYGHSAGAQFVHRYVMMTEPARLDQAVAANAGWYTEFDPGRSYPQGLKLGRREAIAETSGFETQLTILLGTEDIESDDRNLRADAWARAQGKNRFERGRAFFADAQVFASGGKATFAWQLRYAPGIGHENRKMAAYAADILFRRTKASQPAQVLLSVRRAQEAEQCEAAGKATRRRQGLTKSGCAVLSGYEFSVWAARQGVLQASEASVTLDQPVGIGADQELPGVTGRVFRAALIDAGGKDTRESSALQRKLDTLVERGTDLVLLVNSPTDGRVRRTGQYTLVHIPRERLARRDREAGQTFGDNNFLVALTPSPANLKMRLVIYPSMSDAAQRQSEHAGSGPEQWKPFSEAVRRIVMGTRDKIRFESGQDDQGDYLAFDVDWPLGD